MSIEKVFPDDQLVGVISDTHGLLRPEALDALQGADLLIHAGDVGDARVLEGLQAIAPTFGVRGNVDSGRWADTLPETVEILVGSTLLYVIHDLATLDITPGEKRIRAVIYGHSHRPLIERRDGILFLNPGSAGPRRFRLPISLALLHVHGNDLEPRLIELAEAGRGG